MCFVTWSHIDIILKGDTLKKIISLAFAVLFITGCVNLGPKLPNYKIDQKDNVGFIIKTNENMVHTHIGTTVFNNFEKTYPKLVTADDVKKLLKKNIHANLIDISSYKFEDIDNLIIEKDNKWIVNNDKIYTKLIKKDKLKAIIVVSEKYGGIYLYPNYLSSKSSGLLSRSMFGIERYFAVSGFHFKLHILNPIGSKEFDNEMVTAQIIYDPLIDDYQKKSNFVKPANIEALTSEERKSIKKTILELTKYNIEQINKNLSNLK
jgi:hypothetical protein